MGGVTTGIVVVLLKCLFEGGVLPLILQTRGTSGFFGSVEWNKWGMVVECDLGFRSFTLSSSVCQTTATPPPPPPKTTRTRITTAAYLTCDVVLETRILHHFAVVRV